LHCWHGVIRHHFTVDVEEYFQVSAFEGVVRRSDWDHFAARTPSVVPRLLDQLARHGARGTFFVLGWVARRYPGVVRDIRRAGHEIASHGWDHARVREGGAAEFRDSVRRSKRELEDITGEAVQGFRAPSFSITPGREWALDILIEEGYHYDSSLFPIRRPGYGYPDAAPDPHWLERPGGRVAEIPPTTLHCCGVRIPAAGGAYFRILPYALTRAAFKSCERRGLPGTFYIHPWEIDPAQPRLRVPWHTRVRHYSGLARTANRLERLLGDFQFGPIADTVAAL
jgi:polysaccharide deacetylase family protein (PEP-CTERM system associated)